MGTLKPSGCRTVTAKAKRNSGRVKMTKSKREMASTTTKADVSDMLLERQYLYAKEKYCPKVMVSGWQTALETDPKDYDAYSPPCGNYFISTYNRLGTNPDPVLTSETHDMLEQVHTATSPPCQIDVEALETKLANLKRGKIFELKAPSPPMFISTMKSDYTPQNLRPTNPIGYAYFVPEMNRLGLSELCDGRSVRRRGNHKYTDDNLEDFHMMAKLRPMRGYVSFDPTRCVHTYANEPVEGF